MDFCQTLVCCKNYDSEYKQAKKQNEDIFLKKGGFLDIFSRWFEKNKFENFWPKNEEHFQNNSDQKSQKQRPSWVQKAYKNSRLSNILKFLFPYIIKQAMWRSKIVS
jgi:hypothetical protein